MLLLQLCGIDPHGLLAREHLQRMRVDGPRRLNLPLFEAFLHHTHTPRFSCAKGETGHKVA
jgi:hypothetical protein